MNRLASKIGTSVMTLRRWIAGLTLAFSGAGLLAGLGAVLSDNLTNPGDFLECAHSESRLFKKPFREGTTRKSCLAKSLVAKMSLCKNGKCYSSVLGSHYGFYFQGVYSALRRLGSHGFPLWGGQFSNRGDTVGRATGRPTYVTTLFVAVA